VTRPTEQVVVTGMGVVSAAGATLDENWSRVCSGKPTGTLHPAFADLPSAVCSPILDLDPRSILSPQEARRCDRATQFALVAAREAVADAGLDSATWDGARVGIVLGTSSGCATSFEEGYRALAEDGPEWVSPLFGITAPMGMIAGYTAIMLRAYGPNMVVATACAAGPTAIGTARQLLQADLCDIVVAGATEAPLTRLAMASLYQMGALSRRTDDPASASRPFDADRDGMVPAEGAGVMVLERAPDARARGARARAIVAGYGASADGYHLSAPDPDGVGVERAVRAALADAGLSATDIGHVNAHGSSTPLNDSTEAAVIERIYQHPAVTSTKGVTGHALGAAGAMEAVFSVLALEHGLVPPTANLRTLDPEIHVDVVAGATRALPLDAVMTHSFGFGGQNAVVAFVHP